MQAFLHWYTAKKRSEQWLVAAGGLALLLAIVDMVLVGPLQSYAKQTANQAAQQQSANDVLNAELAALKRDDPMAAQKKVAQELIAVQAAIADKRAALEVLEQGLVSAGQMTEVLSNILAMHSGVTLQDIENLRAEPVMLEQSATSPEAQTAADGVTLSTASSLAGDAQFFRHRIRMTLRGRYADILRYLDTVERLPWRVFWDEVALETETYPYSVVTLEFYTVSTEPVWFKVS